MMAFQCTSSADMQHRHKHRHRHWICTVIKPGARDRYSDFHHHTGELRGGLVSVQINRMFLLTLHRLQKWNSSFSAAYWLIDSSESVNSVLNEASTCVTYADWACVCVCVFVSFACRLSSTPLAGANVPCLFLAYTPPSQIGEKRQEDEGGKRVEGAGVRAADCASLPPNQKWSEHVVTQHKHGDIICYLTA